MTLNLTPKLSFEPSFCMFISSNYHTKSNRLKSLDSLFILWVTSNVDTTSHYHLLIKYGKDVVFRCTLTTVVGWLNIPSPTKTRLLSWRFYFAGHIYVCIYYLSYFFAVKDYWKELRYMAEAIIHLTHSFIYLFIFLSILFTSLL